MASFYHDIMFSLFCRLNEVGVVKTSLKDILFCLRKLCECDMTYFYSKLSKIDVDRVNEQRQKDKALNPNKEEPWYPLSRFLLAKMIFQVLQQILFLLLLLHFCIAYTFQKSNGQ